MRGLTINHLGNISNYWTDLDGEKQPVIKSRNNLNFSIPLHAKIRRFVFFRDGFKCQICGVAPFILPDDYDGKALLECGNPLGFKSKNNGNYLVIDHIISLKNGGVSHPENLQVLCRNCNSRKANLIDRVWRA
jgi:hypothetical protein